MKTFLNLLLTFLFLSFLLPIAVMAQTDSTGTSSAVVDSIVSHLPTWVETVITFLVVFVLPAMQFILKRIPTDRSVKITGIIGKLLDIATFFQKDNKTGGSTH